MAIYEIPLSIGNQKFTIQLNKITYKLQFVYRLDNWYIDFFDTSDSLLITGVPLLMGDNLLTQHQHIIKGALYVINTNNDEVQGFFDLGSKIQLYWSDPT